MKQGTIINKILMLLFLGAILLYFAGAVLTGFFDPYPTVQAYGYEVEDTIEATGFLVRTEELLTGNGNSIVRLIPTEGEKVAAGAEVARLYADEAALERAERLELLQTEESQLATAITLAGEDTQQTERSSEVVMEALVKLRASVESGDFTKLENQVSSFKSAVYQQAQRYGDADQLSAALSATRREMDSLRAYVSQDNGTVTTAKSGIFSGQVDGYESLLTAKTVFTLTPSQLDALADGGEEVPSTALARLITDAKWYFVCPLSTEEAMRLEKGDKITVRFSRDWSGEVEMTVEQIGKAEDGRMAVVFSSNRYISDITLLRRQTVELVFDRQSGIRVPTEAVRVEKETKTDKTTGEEIEVQVNCVYVLVGVQAERKEVTVLAQGDDYTLVEAKTAADATVSQQRKALRVGDEVIIAAEEIWDGKVIE